MTHTYTDPRFGDLYVVECDELHNFIYALRYMDSDIVEPITYHRLTDISPQQRSAIEDLIQRKQRYNFPK